MNKLTFHNNEIDDKGLVYGEFKVITERNPISDELHYDILKPTVRDRAGEQEFLQSLTDDLYSLTDQLCGTVPAIDFSDWSYGEPVAFEHDNNLIGKFYLENVKRVAEKAYELSAISMVGILSRVNNYGGLYSQKRAGELIEEIISKAGFALNTDYLIDQDVYSTLVSGLIKPGDCASSLMEVLFATGASILKTDEGMPVFRYVQSGNVKEISTDRVYINNSKIDDRIPVSRVDITEHNYYQLAADMEVTLFDNSDGLNPAVSQVVTFENPCHDLVATPASGKTFTVDESGVNYAIVTGVGTLTGKEYTHTTKIVSKNTDIVGKANIISVTDMTLVSALNSRNVAERVASYYSVAKEVSYGLKVGSERPGDMVHFIDPYGTERTGFIGEMTMEVSSIIKAATRIAVDWTPNHLGNTYSHYALFTPTATIIDGVKSEPVSSWAIPENTPIMRVIVGQGGGGGKNGANGTNARENEDAHDTCYGGSGGAGGLGGKAGKVITEDIVNPSGTATFTAGNGTMTTDGEESSFALGATTLNSADGQILPYGFFHPITGAVLSLAGEKGLNGGSCGNIVITRWQTPSNGGNVVAGETTYNGGLGGGRDASGDYRRMGGGGGGAAYGNGGENGGPTSGTGRWKGGNGANAIPWVYEANSVDETVAELGCGGHGGCGGGGGGAFGGQFHEDEGTIYYNTGNVGIGGTGSQGSKGGDGFILALF